MVQAQTETPDQLQAKLLEYINTKRYTLEEYRSGKVRVSRSLFKMLEDELRELELAFARADANLKKVLVDKCAGE